MSESKKKTPSEGTEFVDARSKLIPPDAFENDYVPRDLSSFMSTDQIAALEQSTAKKKARIAAILKSRTESAPPQKEPPQR